MPSVNCVFYGCSTSRSSTLSLFKLPFHGGSDWPDGEHTVKFKNDVWKESASIDSDALASNSSSKGSETATIDSKSLSILHRTKKCLVTSGFGFYCSERFTLLRVQTTIHYSLLVKHFCWCTLLITWHHTINLWSSTKLPPPPQSFGSSPTSQTILFY